MTKILIDRATVEQALEALDEAVTYVESPSWSPSMADECRKVADALRAALAEPAEPAAPQGEPVVSTCDDYPECERERDALRAERDAFFAESTRLAGLIDTYMISEMRTALLADAPPAAPQGKAVQQWRLRGALLWSDDHPVSNSGPLDYETRVLWTAPTAPPAAPSVPAEHFLRVTKDADGAWLHIKSPSGKTAAINLEALGYQRGGLVGAALLEWTDSLPAAPSGEGTK